MNSDVLKYDGRLTEPPYKTDEEEAECEECARLSDEIEQLRTLAQDARAAWDSDQETKVGKLLRAMLDGDFRKTYRPDLVTPNAELCGGPSGSSVEAKVGSTGMLGAGD